jgi:hypothetical protein
MGINTYHTDGAAWAAAGLKSWAYIDWAAAGIEANDQIVRYQPVVGGAIALTVLRGSDRLVFKAKALKALRGESALRTEVMSFLDMIHRSHLHKLLAMVQTPAQPGVTATARPDLAAAGKGGLPAPAHRGRQRAQEPASAPPSAARAHSPFVASGNVGLRTLEVVCRVDDIGPLPLAVRHAVDEGTCQALRIRQHKSGATALSWLHPSNRLVGGDHIRRMQLREQGEIVLTVLRGPDNLIFRAQALCGGSEMRTQEREAPRPFSRHIGRRRRR